MSKEHQRARVEVRDARAHEREAVRALTRRAYGEYASAMTPAAWTELAGALDVALASENPAHRIVAVDDETLLGSVMLFPPAVAAYGALTGPSEGPVLRLLAIAPEARGRGIGELLVNECIRRARAEGASVLGLHTSVSMRAAIRLYERMGFQRHADSDFQPEGAEQVMGFRLAL